jgi:small subunit ribosomal protein S1
MSTEQDQSNPTPETQTASTSTEVGGEDAKPADVVAHAAEAGTPAENADAPTAQPAAAPQSEAASVGEPVAADGSAEVSSRDAEGAGDEEGEDEGGDEASSDEASAADGTAPGAPKKKRRRRRKKKPAGEGATAEGADGAPAEGAEGAEGSEHKHAHPKKKPEPLPFRIGEEVFGRVERVTDDAIWIDVAGKALGLFDRRDLGDLEPPSVGDQFIATVASHGMRGGALRMARAPFALDDAKKKVEAAKQSQEDIEGFITGAVRGGVEVDIDGLRAFAPASHVDLHPGTDLKHLVGKRLVFTVIQYEKKGRDVVVSRKKFLQAEAKNAREHALQTLAPGSTHRGIVRTVVAWGVFVAMPDSGNLEGLVHASEATHDRAAKLTDLFKPGDEVEVKVVRIDDKGKIWLSRKAMTDDPWEAVATKFAVGTRHKGKVVRLQPFGAFVELEPGIDGLCYTADLSLKPIQAPQEVVKVGDELEFVVANCDSGTRKISLHPAPPEDEASEPRPKVGPGRVLKVEVVHPGEAGLLVRVIGLTGRAARGFIPAGHTNTARGTDLRKGFPVGMKLEAKVLEVDPRRGETKLSIRAMKEDAEKQAYQQYRETVTREAKFGTLGDLLKKS